MICPYNVVHFSAVMQAILQLYSGMVLLPKSRAITAHIIERVRIIASFRHPWMKEAAGKIGLFLG